MISIEDKLKIDAEPDYASFHYLLTNKPDSTIVSQNTFKKLNLDFAKNVPDDLEDSIEKRDIVEHT